ncbi:MAG: hypothetical protein DWQ04_32690 [Chloroflexi bacterium]|nr:MAG: hypothetical protein DWQ04_32690 [Chloroflexota bacterium]
MTNKNIPLLFGPYGSPVLEVAEQLPGYGVNAVWFHGFDAQAFNRCAQHNLAACVEFKTFRADFTQRPDLIPIGVDGKPIRYGDLVQGVCLSKADFIAETEGALLHGLKNFQPAGIWLDYLTYAGWFETPNPDLQESCFCPDCIADFCNTTNLDAANPETILTEHALRWEQHKCQRIASFATHYAELIKSHLPDCIVGAYMCPWTPAEFDRALTRIFAQDYALLAPAIEVFTPLIYANKSGRKPNWGRTFLEQSASFIPADHRVQIILDALDFPASLEAVAASPTPGWGIQLFGGVNVFNHPEKSQVFAQAVRKIRKTVTET